MSTGSVPIRASARLTSKGQVTIPVDIRSALRLETGDSIEFEVVGDHLRVRRTRPLASLFGVVPVPAELVGLELEELRARERAAAAAGWSGQTPPPA